MSTNARSFKERLSNFGLGFWALILIASLAVFAANFIYAAYLAGQENEARSLTAELQVISQKLAKFSKESVDGNADSFAEFKETQARAQVIVDSLNKSHNSQGVGGPLQKVTETWKGMATNASRIVKSEQQILNLADTAAQFNSRIPQISARLSEVVSAMSDSNAPASQINLANRQVVLADRMSRRVTEILAGGERAVSAADALSRDSAVFGQVLKGLKEGSPDLNVI